VIAPLLYNAFGLGVCDFPADALRWQLLINELGPLSLVDAHERLHPEYVTRYPEYHAQYCKLGLCLFDLHHGVRHATEAARLGSALSVLSSMQHGCLALHTPGNPRPTLA
jgi:hypothetical protein